MIPSLEELLNSIPDEQRTPEIVEGVKEKYELELQRMQTYIDRATNPDAVLNLFHKSGSQLIAEFWVNDQNKPRGNEVNWHLQNVSQWLYAGCILIDNNQVSTHH